MFENLKNIKINLGVYKKLVFVVIISFTLLLVTYKYIYGTRLKSRHLCEEKLKGIELNVKEAESKISELNKIKSSIDTESKDLFVKKFNTEKIKQIPELLKSLTKDSIKLVNFQPQDEKVLTFKSKNIISQKVNIETEMSFSTLIELINKMKDIPVLNKIESISITSEEKISPFIKANIVMIIYSGNDLNI